MNKAEQPTITQADREAAEAVYPAFLASLKGEDGGYGLAQAFARHRTTSLAAQDGLVEALRVNVREAIKNALHESTGGRNISEGAGYCYVEMDGEVDVFEIADAALSAMKG